MQGKVIIGTELDTTSFDAQIDYVQSQLLDIEDMLKRADAGEEIGKDTLKLEAQYEMLTEKLKKLVNKKQELDKSGMINFEKSMDSINASTSKIIKNISKWGLALFGIRSMYSFIRSAVNQVVQEDEVMKNQIEYMKYAIGTAFKPVFEFILNIIYKIIAGIGAVIKLMTKFNIFSKATASNFNKANVSATSLKKTLAGFDEMNVLNDNGSVGLLGSGSDWIPPDLPDKVEEIAQKIKEWFTKGLPTREELQDNAETYKNAWIRVGEFLGLGTVFDGLKQNLNQLKEDTRPLWEPILSSFNYYIEQVKILFKPFTDYVNEHLLNPVKEKLTDWKDKFLSRYAKFINKLIYYANLFLQYFGIQLEYIDEESAVTGKDIEKNVGDAMKKVKTDSDNTVNSLGKVFDKLKDITSRAWDLAINYVTRGDINEKLQPLRDALGKIGINLPRLANGGIVYNPGNGVFMGGYVAGEGRNPEAVIPLDDETLDRLGEAFARHTTINASIINSMNGRIISKELQRINAEEDFAYNR